MTKPIRAWWRTVTFWNKIRLTIAGFGVSGEVGIHLVGLGNNARIIGIACTAIAFIITYLFKDEDNNGQVDILEHRPKI